MKLRIIFPNNKELVLHWNWKLHEKFIQFLMVFNNSEILSTEDFLKCPNAHLLFTFFNGSMQEIRWEVDNDGFLPIKRWEVIK